MKWYKKQMDQLKLTKAEAPKSSLDEITKKKTSGHTFDARKTSGMKTNISPVMTRNRNRPKTDSK